MKTLFASLQIFLLCLFTASAIDFPNPPSKLNTTVVNNLITSSSNVSSRVVYASNAGCALNTNLLTGGGTDDTLALQTILNSATSTPLTLVVERPAATTGLYVYSNTKLVFPPGSGLFLLANAGKPIIQNFNRNITTINDSNIEIEGGFFQGNAANNTAQFESRSGSLNGAYITGLEFDGVDGLRIRNVEMRDIRQMNIHCSNVKHVYMENINCNAVLAGLGGINTIGFPSGIHFNGPAQWIVLKNIMANVGDDVVALNATDDLSISQWGHGNISDVLVDGLTIHGARQGIRILSGSNSGTTCAVDRVTLQHIKGDAYACGLQVNNWTNGGGSVGTLCIEDFNVSVTGAYYNVGNGPSGGQQMWSYMQFGCPISNLVINNFFQSDSFDARYPIYVDSNANITQMIVNNAIFTSGTPINVATSGTIGKLTVGLTNQSGTASWPTTRIGIQNLVTTGSPSNVLTNPWVSPDGKVSLGGTTGTKLYLDFFTGNVSATSSIIGGQQLMYYDRTDGKTTGILQAYAGACYWNVNADLSNAKYRSTLNQWSMRMGDDGTYDQFEIFRNNFSSGQGPIAISGSNGSGLNIGLVQVRYGLKVTGTLQLSATATAPTNIATPVAWGLIQSGTFIGRTPIYQ